MTDNQTEETIKLSEHDTNENKQGNDTKAEEEESHDIKYKWNSKKKGYDTYIKWEDIPQDRRKKPLLPWEFTPGSYWRYPWRAVNWSGGVKYVTQKDATKSLQELSERAQNICQGYVESRVSVKQEMAAISTFLAGFAIGYVFDIDKESFDSSYSDNDDVNEVIDNIFFTLYSYSIIISAISLLFNAAATIKFVSDIRDWVGEGCYMAENCNDTYYPSYLAAYSFQRNGGVSNLGWITLNKKYVDYIDKSFLYGIGFFMLAMIFSFFGKGIDLWIAIPNSILVLWVAAVIYKMWNRSFGYGT